jgi:DNA-binding Lrp family transcriptional regulator
MDPIDLLLIKMLLKDSRTPYRELAESLELSVNAVHKRIQLLMASGVITRFTTKVSLPAVDAVVVIIYGLSKGRTDEISERLGRDEHVYWVSQASGGMLYVGAYLRNISELYEVMMRVRAEGLVDHPMVGIIPLPPLHTKDRTLSRMDQRIICSLKSDARKAVSDIAKELNTSAKTIRRRLDRMLASGLIECSVDWFPDKTNDIISMFHLQVEPSIDRFGLLTDLMAKFGTNGLFFFLFSNNQDTVLFCTWSGSMSEVNDQRRRLDKEDGIIASTPYILFSGQVYPTWRDQMADNACP